ncbi:MAG: DUF2236 domain-containing protein [Actinomycetota bacterium]|nr:DUF2236 domain-containing protein [Actinomycetota bacterium]
MTDRDAPLYGPDTLSWQVFQEWMFLLGGMRAVLMQLAHPEVAAGVANHSDYHHDTFGRLHRTMQAMWTIGVGEVEEARTALLRMQATHRNVRGVSPAGRAYDAADPWLRLWVHATLIDTVLAVEERYLRRFDLGDRRRFYRESLLLADEFGIPAELVPDDLEAFSAYIDRQVTTLQVSDQARHMAEQVLHPRVPGVPDLLYAPLRLVTADLLPEEFREAYHLPWNRYYRHGAMVIQVATRVVGRMPQPVRTLPILELAAHLGRRLSLHGRRLGRG